MCYIVKCYSAKVVIVIMCYSAKVLLFDIATTMLQPRALHC